MLLDAPRRIYCQIARGDIVMHACHYVWMRVCARRCLLTYPTHPHTNVWIHCTFPSRTSWDAHRISFCDTFRLRVVGNETLRFGFRVVAYPNSCLRAWRMSTESTQETHQLKGIYSPKRSLSIRFPVVSRASYGFPFNMQSREGTHPEFQAETKCKIQCHSQSLLTTMERKPDHHWNVNIDSLCNLDNTIISCQQQNSQVLMLLHRQQYSISTSDGHDDLTYRVISNLVALSVEHILSSVPSTVTYETQYFHEWFPPEYGSMKNKVCHL